MYIIQSWGQQPVWVTSFDAAYPHLPYHPHTLPTVLASGGGGGCNTIHSEQYMVDATTSKHMMNQMMNNIPEKRVIDEVTGGEKGQKDCQIGAVDPKAVWEVGRVAGFGGVKYERYNFAKGYKWSLSYDALQRHLMQFWAGEANDAESGLCHLAHAAWHCLALLTFYLRGKGTDDRFPA